MLLEALLVFCLYFSSNLIPLLFFFFFFNDTATTEIYTLSLHDALPILDDLAVLARVHELDRILEADDIEAARAWWTDRKSTRLNSSHGYISYAVFCLKKKNKNSNNSARDLY